MVGTAERPELALQGFDWNLAELQLADFDWNLAELQLADVAGHGKSPGNEVYGRSLSAMRKLGALMMHMFGAEVIDSPEADQARIEFRTSVDEGFGTDPELGGGLEVRDFDVRPVIDGRVMAKDLKTTISSMTKDGLICALDKARKDPRFLRQLVRSYWDHKNALLVDAMARGETGYNTRIVVSPFPEEGAAESGDPYWRQIGYVPHLKRSFVQLYHVTKDGTVISGSLSFDGTNKQRLREIFGRFGIDIPAGEITDNWLRHAITGNFSVEAAKAIGLGIADKAGDPKYKKNANTVDVTEKYKPLIDRVFDESYIHICESLARGYQTDGVAGLILQLAHNAHNFNDHYATALYRMRAGTWQFTDADSAILHELLVYSTIEMMRALHLGMVDPQNATYKNIGGIGGLTTYLYTAEASAFQNMLSGFGAEGARNNRTYSACGLSISLGEEANRNNPQSAFGGVEGEGAGHKKAMSCPYCGTTVVDDPCAKILSCGDCAALVVGGKVISEGNGGSRAREERRRAADAERAARRKVVTAKLAKRHERLLETSGGGAPKWPQASRQLAVAALTP